MERLKNLRSAARLHLDGLISGEELYTMLMERITALADNAEADENMKALAEQLVKV